MQAALGLGYAVVKERDNRNIAMCHTLHDFQDMEDITPPNPNSPNSLPPTCVKSGVDSCVVRSVINVEMAVNFLSKY